MKYEVVFDRSSTYIKVEADNEEEAREKASKIYNKDEIHNFETWIAEANDENSAWYSLDKED